METLQQFIQRKNEQFKKAKPIRMKDIGRKGWHIYTREAWTFMPESTIKEKVLLLERLRLSSTKGEITHQDGNKTGKIVYRIGYFMIGKNGNRKGKWVWGQFCPIIPAKDLNKLMSKAKKEGTIK